MLIEQVPIEREELVRRPPFGASSMLWVPRVNGPQIGHQRPVWGLFRLHDKRLLHLHMDLAGDIIMADDTGVVNMIINDMMTGFTLYTFGQESYGRLLVYRPARTGLDALAQYGAQAMALVREDAPLVQATEFAVDPAAHADWIGFINGRRAHYQKLINALRQGESVSILRAA